MVTEADREAAAFEARLREMLGNIQMPVIVKEDSKGYHRLYQSPEEPHFVTGDLLAETFGDGDGLIAEAVNALPRLLDEIQRLRHRTASTAALTAEVDKIARIIEPAAWASFDRTARPFAEGRGGNSDEGFWYIHAYRAGCKTPEDVRALWEKADIEGPVQMAIWRQSLAKAKAIAALSTPSGATSPNPDEVQGVYSAFEVSEPVAEKVVVIPEWLAKDILHFCEANAAFPPRETLIPIGAINAFRERMERAVSEPVADHIGGEVDTIDQEALARWRGIANEGDGHDQAGLNKNTLRRLIATIDALATPPNTNGYAVREALDPMALYSIYNVLHHIYDTCEDEGDRIYLGSTNDHHTLKRQLRRPEKMIPLEILYPDATLAKHGGAE